MYRGCTVGVVVPAYNEEPHVGEVLSTIPTFVDRIYAIDDCSTDGTWDVIRECAAASEADSTDGLDQPISEPVDDPPRITDGSGYTDRTRIVPVRHDENQGAGGALRTGYQYAHADGVDVTVAMDADGQMDPDQLPTLLDPIVEGVADYAKGNRLATRDNWREMPPFRLFGNWLLTLLTKVSSGYWHVQDPQNGYTAISHEALSAIDLEEIPDDHDYTNDLLVRLKVAGMRVADVSMPAVYRDEESTIQFRRFVLTTSVTLARGFLWRLRNGSLANGRYAVPMCYTIGTIGALVGVTLALVTLAGSIVGDQIVGVSLTVLVAIVGLSLFAFLGATTLDARENRALEVTC